MVYCVINCIFLYLLTSYLHVAGPAYGRPIAGQKEVSGVSSKSQGNLWRATVSIAVIIISCYLFIMVFQQTANCN